MFPIDPIPIDPRGNTPASEKRLRPPPDTSTPAALLATAFLLLTAACQRVL